MRSNSSSASQRLSNSREAGSNASRLDRPRGMLLFDSNSSWSRWIGDGAAAAAGGASSHGRGPPNTAGSSSRGRAARQLVTGRVDVSAGGGWRRSDRRNSSERLGEPVNKGFDREGTLPMDSDDDGGDAGAGGGAGDEGRFDANVADADARGGIDVSAIVVVGECSMGGTSI